MKYRNLRHLALSGMTCLLALVVTNCSDDSKKGDAAAGSAGQAGDTAVEAGGAGGEAGQTTAVVLVCSEPTKVSKCDPVSAAPCDVSAGETCDYSVPLGGFECFPGPNPVKPSDKCDFDSLFCGPNTTCDVQVSMCEHYCCADSDCAHGTCTLKVFDDGQASVGVCYDEYQPASGAAGAAGAAGAGG